MYVWSWLLFLVLIQHLYNGNTENELTTGDVCPLGHFCNTEFPRGINTVSSPSK